jgi:DNA-binding transcriptional ArsR family regulator
MSNVTNLGQARVLDALGDPTRRAVLELLRDGERSVRELTDATEVSQPAVSQHLRVLREAGLVTVRAQGTRRLHAVDLDGLAGLRAWVDAFWDDALAAFVEHAEGEVRS